MEGEPKPYSADDILDKVNGAGRRNVTRPVVEGQIARAVYEMRVDPYGEGVAFGSADNFDQTDGKVIEMAKDETTAEDAGKKPARRFPFIVPY